MTEHEHEMNQQAGNLIDDVMTIGVPVSDQRAGTLSLVAPSVSQHE
jgi:hypothetical protein